MWTNTPSRGSYSRLKGVLGSSIFIVAVLWSSLYCKFSSSQINFLCSLQTSQTTAFEMEQHIHRTGSLFLQDWFCCLSMSFCHHYGLLDKNKQWVKYSFRVSFSWTHFEVTARVWTIIVSLTFQRIDRCWHETERTNHSIEHWQRRTLRMRPTKHLSFIKQSSVEGSKRLEARRWSQSNTLSWRWSAREALVKPSSQEALTTHCVLSRR